VVVQLRGARIVGAVRRTKRPAFGCNHLFGGLTASGIRG
jgi:hypothetical protein